MQTTKLIKCINQCMECKQHLPLEPRPVVRFASQSRILIIGQAPSITVHKTGIPWNDASGKRLREWMQVSEDQFYDEKNIAIVPMGFCYPGKKSTGDLPPRPECAPLWHEKILATMPNIQLTLLIGQYAQNYYTNDNYKTITERISHWQKYLPDYLPLPHPSPRNRFWLQKNPWFEKDVLPVLQTRIKKLLVTE